jgi:adenylate cyclase
VLFSDLRAFATLSPELEPARIAETLAANLTEITAIVNRHGGVIDKFIGDCMMVLYNAPRETRNHALQAVQTALELEERTRDISGRWEARLGRAIRCSVGISTGRAFVGNIGSTQRMQYGAVGYTVELASRLESLTEEYNAPIVISETTHRHLAGRVPTRELGEVIPKDMTRPVKIFAVFT